jgi:hypothetical protein
MEKSLPTAKYERRWQLGIYGIAILFMVWDLLFQPSNNVLDDFESYSPYFLYITIHLLSISWFLVLKSPRLGAHSAVVSSTISLVSYLIIGFINLVSYQYYALDILRFYLLRIFASGAVLIYSHKILQSPSGSAELSIPIFFFNLHWTPKTQRYVVLAFIMALGILGIQWLYPRASCAVIGGRWTRDGILGQAQYCLHSYPDAGTACQSSEDCMGRCLAETNSSGVISIIPTAGVCAPDNRVFGCFEIFENQEISLVCID